MKIRAIRVAEVGRFVDGVALEGLGDGLTVFAGPNETGKSTLFRALNAVFTVPYSTKPSSVRELQPYDGGGPTIEVEFEAAGQRWRLRKTFLKKPAATLENLSEQSRPLTGADVQARVAELVQGPDGFERFGVLWVQQGASLSVHKPDEVGADQLRTLVQREVSDTVTEDASRRLLATVGERIALWQTAHKPPRPTGAYLTAQKTLAAAQTGVETLHARFTQAETARAKLETARAARDDLQRPDAVDALTTAADAAARALAEATAAARKLEQAQQMARAEEGQFKSATIALQRFERDLADHAKRVAEVTALRAQASTHGERQAAAFNENRLASRTAHAGEGNVCSSGGGACFGALDGGPGRGAARPRRQRRGVDCCARDRR